MGIDNNSEATRLTEAQQIERPTLKRPSPIEVIGIAAMVCSSAFGFAAANLNDPQSFKYCIHMFLAIIGFLLLTAMWSPGALYHPQDLASLPEDQRPRNHPKVLTIYMFMVFILYMLYQLAIRFFGGETT